MNYKVNEHFDNFILTQVKSGRFKNPSEVIQTALQLLESQELKREELKQHVEKAIERGGEHSQQEVSALLGIDD